MKYLVDVAGAFVSRSKVFAGGYVAKVYKNSRKQWNTVVTVKRQVVDNRSGLLEAEAMIEGLSYLYPKIKEGDKIFLRAHSPFLDKVLRNGLLDHWKKLGWKYENGNPVDQRLITLYVELKKHQKAIELRSASTSTSLFDAAKEEARYAIELLAA